MTNVSYQTIIKKAKDLKNGVEKNKKLEVVPRWSYYFAKYILTPNKSIKKNPNMHTTKGNAIKPRGDVIKAKIYKADYIDCCKRLVAYVEKYNRLPSFITWKGKRIRVRTYAYNLAKIVVYYANHNNTYPAYNTINTDIWKKNTIKKYGHATKPCADNRGQNNGYYCGCHSLQEVFRNLTNIVVPQSVIAKWAGTTSGGTSHSGIRTAVAQFNKKYKKNLKVVEKNHSEIGWDGIKKIINSKNQDCIIHNLYRNQYGHYEVVNKVGEVNVAVQNSLGSKCNRGCYCGYVETRSRATFKSYINGISQKSVIIITNA